MECLRCGKCCEDYNPYRKDKKGPCPYLGYENGKAFCKKQKTKIKVCREYFCNKCGETK